MVIVSNKAYCGRWLRKSLGFNNMYFGTVSSKEIYVGRRIQDEWLDWAREYINPKDKIVAAGQCMVQS